MPVKRDTCSRNILSPVIPSELVVRLNVTVLSQPNTTKTTVISRDLKTALADLSEIILYFFQCLNTPLRLMCTFQKQKKPTECGCLKLSPNCDVDKDESQIYANCRKRPIVNNGTGKEFGNCAHHEPKIVTK